MCTEQSEVLDKIRRGKFLSLSTRERSVAWELVRKGVLVADESSGYYNLRPKDGKK